jgi:acyl-CoA thioester hydrolase
MDPYMDPITYKGCVYPWQCAQIGHMNIMWYVGNARRSPYLAAISARRGAGTMPEWPRGGRYQTSAARC